MDWQQIVSLMIVAIAASALAWAKFRPRKLNLQSGTHCGCVSSGSSAGQSSIVFHARKGGRPQIRMKMK